MTTIAIDEWGLIAWDSQTTYLNTRVFLTKDKVIFDPKLDLIIAGAGDLGAVQMVPSWLRGGKKKDKKPEGAWDAFTFDKNHRLLLYANDLNTAVEVCLPYAIGSGSTAARSAMAARADAKSAVEIACTFDIFSSLPVNTLHINDIWKT